ncbi:MAG: S9 family peptidase, partial [Rhodothermales bacterium]|nr:S9 family peptidase [Rhodothermales bacterium]
LLSGAFTGNLGTFVFTPDGTSILLNGLHRTNRNLYRLDVTTGDLEQITQVTGSLDVRAFSKDRSRMVYSFSNTETPPDLYVSPTARLDPVRLTDLNPLVRDSLLLATAELRRWDSTDGTEIEGRLLLPPGFDGSEAPLLLHIHGGPAGVFTNRFSYRDHVWAGLGYVQLMPNVRGSSGYDDALLRGNMRDIGGGDYQDLMTGVDAMIEEGLADPERLAVRGWSYGGILGGWTITQTHRFKAASVGAMVSDWTSEYGPGFNYDVSRWYLGGTPWENAELWRERSPLTHAHKVRTPTLIIHGMNDTTDTEPQSMMFFAAIRDGAGAPVRYIRFPREPHGFREPRHQRTRDVEEIRWIHERISGGDWTPWTPPTKPAAAKAKPATD